MELRIIVSLSNARRIGDEIMEFLLDFFKFLCLVAGCLFMIVIITGIIIGNIETIKSEKRKKELNAILNNVLNECVEEIIKESMEDSKNKTKKRAKTKKED